MGNDINRTARDFYGIIEGVTKNERKGGYDTQATVRRIEDGIAWVHIPGGVDETPAKLTISASEGDVVQVRVVNGRAFLIGNASAPPTDDKEAIKALTMAGSAAQAAGIAWQKAEEATADAERAHEAAMSAQDDAERAQASADAAQTSADNAQTSATTANTAANNALSGLSMVESVVDVVNWFAEHKTASTDTTVNANKTYYSYDASTGVLTKLDPVGTENPSALGWYELDDAISQYVATHVATTNDGLYVVSTANGWRVLVSSGGGNYPAGVLIIDPNGNVAQQTTINGVEFNTGRPVKIGDQTAYINFDGNGHITVIGADLTIGGENNVNGVLTVKDANGEPIGTWDNSGIMLTAGSRLRVNAPDGRNVMNLGVLNNISGYAHVSYDVENPNGQTVFPMDSGDTIIPREVISCKYDNDGSDVGIPVTIQQQDGNYVFVFTSAPLRAFHLVYSTDSLVLTTTIGTRVTENTRGINSILIGCENDTYFQGSIAIGNMIDNRAAWSTGIGLGLQVGKAFQTILGRFNDPTPTYSNQKDIFVIGNGTSDTDRFNLLTLTDWGWLHSARYYSGEKRGWFTGTGVGISDDGKIILQRTTSGSNAINSDNPLIYFANADASQLIGLVFTDYDSVQAPASLTLAGNQGGEYFIAPYVKATSGIYVGDTDGNFVHIFPCAVDAIGDGSTSAWLQAKQSTNNAIYIQAEVDGQVTLGSKGANNTYYTILKRRNNAHDIDIFGNWYVNTAFILLNNHWIYYADSSGTNRILTGANSNNEVFFGYGSYTGNIGNVYLDGNTVYLRSKNSIYFYGTTTAQVTSSGNFQSGASSSTGGHFFKVWNNKKQGSLYADTSGNLGIYCDTHSKWLIYINSSGTVVANTSDIRYKENISTMPESDALSILREIDIINFSYKEDEEHLMQSGVSAQQLRDVVLKHGIKEHAYITMGSTIEGDTSVYTDITMPDKDIRYEIDYGKLVPVIWKGWQYQDKRIAELEARIKELERRAS